MFIRNLFVYLFIYLICLIILFIYQMFIRNIFIKDLSGYISKNFLFLWFKNTIFLINLLSVTSFAKFNIDGIIPKARGISTVYIYKITDGSHDT